VEGEGRERAAGRRAPEWGGNRLDQAYVETPDGVRMEILEDKTQTVPIRNEHIHFFVPAAEIPKAVEWYAKTFGGVAATRNNAPVVNLPGVQLRFNAADTKQAPTRGRVLDHIGFDTNDHPAFVRRLEGMGIKLDQPVGKGATGNTITYITDPGAPGSKSSSGYRSGRKFGRRITKGSMLKAQCSMLNVGIGH
jgi:catechol 2,3-dioxygenase-like lactoylglutathione lyase family enzyme